VLATLEEPPPPGMSHWDGPAVAEKLDASVHAVWRVLRRIKGGRAMGLGFARCAP